MKAYDLIVLGGGPAGYCAAERAGAMGKSVLLLERAKLGGVCLNEGCIPSKTLLNSAKVFKYAAHGEPYGISAENVTADPAAIVARKNDVVKKLVAGVGMKMKKHGVEVVSARGMLAGRGAEGIYVEANDERFAGTNVLIATGSEPSVPPIAGAREGVSSGEIWTSRQALDAMGIPPRLCVIGGGVIGMEMAGYFSAMGSKVTVVEMLPTIGGPVDPAIAAALLNSYPDIDFCLNSRVTEIQAERVFFDRAGKSEIVEADRVLLCIGRRPSAEGIGLETLHIATERGAVLTDASGRTNVPGVYAAGDVNGRSMLAHTAYREAECAVAAMFGEAQKVDYDVIPSVIYTTPEIACVGLTEAQAKERGYAVKTVMLPMAYSGRYLAESSGDASFLSVVADAKARRLLGVHMIGPYASEIIYGAGFMVSTRMTIEALRQQVFPHPTVAEILREALFEL